MSWGVRIDVLSSWLCSALQTVHRFDGLLSLFGAERERAGQGDVQADSVRVCVFVCSSDNCDCCGVTSPPQR